MAASKGSGGGAPRRVQQDPSAGALGEALERERAARRAAERRLWDAIEASRDGFALFDSEDRLVVANAAYSAFLSRVSAQIRPGTRYARMLQLLSRSEVLELHGQDSDAWLAGMLAWHREGAPGDRLLELAGNRWIQVSEQRSAEGETVSLVTSVTAIKRREAELIEARRAAEAADRSKSAFLANMSHEIRTPMNGIIGMADLLCETPLNEEQRLFARTIRSSGEALLVIINDVLDYSKIEAGKMELFEERFNLERCLHEVVTLLQPKARERGLDLLIDYDMFLPAHYRGDAARIRQILTNLVGNAVKFTESGFVLVRVVGFESADGRQDIHIAVEDSGIGIAADRLDHVFGEFARADDPDSRRFEGTGLGLAISRRLVEMMGGEIWAESTPGEGSVFGFRLSLPIDRSSPEEVPLRLSGSLKRVLIVDDLEVNRLILERQLGFLGLQVSACASGAEALERLEAGGFDLLLTDHQMPAMDGVALARAVRARGMRLPMLLISSGNSLPADSAEAGLFAACLRKPVLRRDLCEGLAALAGSGPAPPAPVPPSPERPARPGGRRLRVLCAEDNMTSQLVLAKMLADQPLDLTFVGTGRAAAAQAGKGGFDLILMDISMPDLDGIAATGMIREREREQGAAPVPIVALTAHAMSGDAERFLAAGMDGYLTKPLRKAQLCDTIARLTPPRAP